MRERGEVRYAAGGDRKAPRGVELTAHGISGHGSVPLASNPIAHLAQRRRQVRDLAARDQVNETTGTYFRGLAASRRRRRRSITAT